MSNNLTILFINVSYVKERSSIMENVEDKFIKSHIFQAQDIHLQNILGSTLYEDMINNFNINTGTFDNQNYIELNEKYIQPCLLYYTLYESLDDLYAKITNKSIVIQNSENSTPITEAYLSKRKEDYLNKAEYYAERLTNYLLRNKNLYSLWLNHQTYEDTIKPDLNKRYFSNGWYLKDVNDCRE